MLKIENKNEVDTDDSTVFQLMADYTMLGGYVYRELVKEFGTEKAKDFMLDRLIKMVSTVEV